MKFHLLSRINRESSRLELKILAKKKDFSFEKIKIYKKISIIKKNFCFFRYKILLENFIKKKKKESTKRRSKN